MTNLDFPSFGEQLRRIKNGRSLPGPFRFRAARPVNVLPASVVVLHLSSLHVSSLLPPPKGSARKRDMISFRNRNRRSCR